MILKVAATIHSSYKRVSFSAFNHSSLNTTRACLSRGQTNTRYESALSQTKVPFLLRFGIPLTSPSLFLVRLGGGEFLGRIHENNRLRCDPREAKKYSIQERV